MKPTAVKTRCKICRKLTEYDDLASRGKGQKYNICKACYNKKVQERRHLKNPEIKSKHWKKFDPDDFHCHKCGELKTLEDFCYSRGQRTGICKDCYNKKQQKYYRKKNPQAKPLRTKYDPNDFHCRKCGQLKRPDEFIINKNGNRSGICRACDLERRKELHHKKNPEAKYRPRFDPQDLHCTRCGELYKPENFKYTRGRRQGLCKVCLRERSLELYHYKSPDSKYAGNLPHKVDKDFDYGAARNLIGKYKVCPVCGQEKHYSDFSRETLMRLPLYYHYFRPDYALVIREFYEECSDCRNRMQELHDHFIMHAY